MVRILALTPDDHFAISGSDDHTLRIWDLRTGALHRALTGHAGWVRALAVSPDGAQLVSGSDDRTGILWDVASGALQRRLEGHEGIVRCVCFAPPSAVLTASDDGTLRLWSSLDGALLRVLPGHSAWVRSASVSAGLALSGGYDRTARLWDLRSGECLALLQGHPGWIRQVALSPDGATAVTASYDATLRVWEAPSGRLLHVLEGHDDIIMHAHVAADSATLVSASTDLTVCVWDLRSGALRLRLGSTRQTLNVCLTPDGGRAVTASADKMVRVFCAATGRQLATLAGHEGWVRCVVCTQEGDNRALSGSSDRTMRLWSLETFALERVFQCGAMVISLALHPDGRTALAGCSDLLIKLFDLRSGEGTRQIAGHSGWVRNVACSPDGSAVASSSGDQTVRVWDFETGLQRLQMGHTESQRRAGGLQGGHVHIIPGCVFSADGKAVVSASYDKTVRVWDPEACGSEVARLEGHASWVRAVACMGSELLASASYDRSIRIWNQREARQVLVLDHPAYMLCVAAHTDGSRLVGGSEDGSLHLYDLDPSVSPPLIQKHQQIFPC